MKYFAFKPAVDNLLALCESMSWQAEEIVIDVLKQLGTARIDFSDIPEAELPAFEFFLQGKTGLFRVVGVSQMPYSDYQHPGDVKVHLRSLVDGKTEDVFMEDLPLQYVSHVTEVTVEILALVREGDAQLTGEKLVLV